MYIQIQPGVDSFASLAKLELCIKDVISWCTINALLCNPDKTEVIHFFSPFSRSETIRDIVINGTPVTPVHSVRNLGVVLDKHLNISSHINNICKSASLAIRNIGRIRRYLNQADTERLVHAFVTSKLGSCNSLLYGVASSQIDKLQRIQNTAARLVIRSKKFTHITPVLRDLHWLPVKNRIIFKILLLTYKALKGIAPSYLSDLISGYTPPRRLRTRNKHLLTIPKCRTKTYGERAFSVAGPKLWNSLPETVKNAEGLASFKTKIKSLLFNT